MKGGFGRLSSGPNPVLHEVLYAPHLAEDREEVLPHLLAIDAAHVAMLAERGVLPRATAARILFENRALAKSVAAGEPVLPAGASHRGLYLLYEQHLVARLGPEVGGAGHVARSRNDLNATVVRMRARQALLELLAQGEALLGAMLRAARAHLRTFLPGFTHLQPAQPSTFAHYLAAVAFDLLRGVEQLWAVVERANRCPMGASAGFGTSIPIDSEQVARLLGFAGPVDSSLDAVASRDFVLDALATQARIGVALTRMANDLQHWASRAYGILDWPDDLVSTSSIMPQKRNAFVLENIRGLAAWPSGCLQGALAMMKGTPFTNGIEGGTEGVRPLWSAAQALGGALRLTELLIANVRVDAQRARASMEGTDIFATAVADMLVVSHRLAFRSAHELVASVIGQGFDDPAAIAQGLSRAANERLSLELNVTAAQVQACLGLERCVEAARFGGGPGPESVERQLARLEARLEAVQLASGGLRTALVQADQLLESTAHTLIAGEHP